MLNRLMVLEQIAAEVTALTNLPPVVDHPSYQAWTLDDKDMDVFKKMMAQLAETGESEAALSRVDMLEQLYEACNRLVLARCESNELTKLLAKGNDWDAYARRIELAKVMDTTRTTIATVLAKLNELK